MTSSRSIDPRGSAQGTTESPSTLALTERLAHPLRRRKRLGEGLAAGLLVLLAALLSVSFFEKLPIEGTSLGIDWQDLWPAIRGGVIRYEGTGLRNPPWSILPVLPLGLLSMRSGWAILTLATIACLMFSVPQFDRPGLRLAGILLLVSSFPAVRHAADGNFEGLVIAGMLLMLHGLAVQSPWWLAGGVLLATAKPQESWLVLLLVIYRVAARWPRKAAALAGALIACVTVPLLLVYGRDWLQSMVEIPQRGGIMDISVAAAASRLSLEPWITVVLWAAILGATAVVCLRDRAALTRKKITFAISASLLLSPYSAGNSLLAVLALGILPGLRKDPGVTLALIALMDAPYAARLLSWDVVGWQAGYWTVMLLLTWAVLGIRLLQAENRLAEDVVPVE